MNTHTPGPWSVENCRNEDGSKFLSINGQGPLGSWLAEIQAGNIDGKPADTGPLHLANARLIAAAPDLLEALRYLDDAINEPSLKIDLVAASNRARAVIAKAEGQA